MADPPYNTTLMPTKITGDARSQPVLNRDAVDPHRVPVTYVDRCPIYDVWGTSAAVTLTSYQMTPTQDGTFVNDAVVAARLRFNLETAREMRDTLNSIIKIAEENARG